MFLRKTDLLYGLLTAVVIVCVHADAMDRGVSRVCQDPFYPKYLSDPRNTYEEQMVENAAQQSAPKKQVQMVMCDDDPLVVFDGVTYKKGDRFMHGIVEEITCDYMVVKNENTEIVTRFVDNGLVEKAS